MNRIFFAFFSVLSLLAVTSSAQSLQIEDNKLVLDEPIYFETGSARIKPESEATLEKVKAFLESKTYVSLMRVEGHASGSGKDQKLSEERANAVCKWLKDNGVDCKRLLPVGFGNTKPAADDSTPEGRAANTRIVFAMASLRDRAIGGMPTDGGGQVAGDPCN